ncbi:MAG: aminotransferase class I/II-fold pyridoxal phosphate-dependent enzyme, partial [Myxococcales bacterium]|nr:aminotransferase class I/II-fold pyridoxal phosphate-dependent enzyme [Myxococcales bacterium]
IPGVHCRPPDGCYVVFVDIRETGQNVEDLCKTLLEEHRVAVVPGLPRWFGPGAEGHLRICFATSRALLVAGLDRLSAGLGAAP